MLITFESVFFFKTVFYQNYLHHEHSACWKPHWFVCINARACYTQQLRSITGSRAPGRGNEMWTGSIKVMLVGRATVTYVFFFFFITSYLWPRLFFLTLKNRMETLLFLFPQFNYMAQKEEAYFKMLVPEDSQAAKMKDDSSGLVDSRLI